jgi:ubiquinone/menaquinone biosynthesis C-methylase UbiE
VEAGPRSFIPAAGRDWLLPLYDPLQWLLGGDALKRPLVEQAGLVPGLRVLDIGCGTGSLTLLIKRLHPAVEVTGLDPDPKALAIAKRKAERAGLAIRLERGFSNPLPYADACFERVFSSLMFHHLTQHEKMATLVEVRRVLAPGGSLHLLDFGPPRSGFSRAAAHVLHRAGHVHDNLEGRIPDFLAQAGFVHTEEVAERGTFVGSLSFYRAVNPGRGWAGGTV